jgi:uroporphyrin-III C-methyltransferase
MPGSITMVGSGPGDPDLLTLAASKVLSDPSALVVSDRLVSDAVLSLVNGEVRVANKHPGCAEMAQEEIYRWCAEGLAQGRRVVRLKIGDPFVFGRGGEEVLEFRKMGYEPAVVPGVSSAFAAPLLGGIPVTHRGVANQVVMCTGYGRDGTSVDLIQYHPEQTAVFLMAVGRLEGLCRDLVNKAGYPKETPVGIVEAAGCPGQRTVVGNLMDIARKAKELGVKPPSVVVVGGVVDVLGCGSGGEWQKRRERSERGVD